MSLENIYSATANINAGKDHMNCMLALGHPVPVCVTVAFDKMLAKAHNLDHKVGSMASSINELKEQNQKVVEENLRFQGMMRSKELACYQISTRDREIRGLKDVVTEKNMQIHALEQKLADQEEKFTREFTYVRGVSLANSGEVSRLDAEVKSLQAKFVESESKSSSLVKQIEVKDKEIIRLVRANGKVNAELEMLQEQNKTLQQKLAILQEQLKRVQTEDPNPSCTKKAKTNHVDGGM